MPKDEQAQWRTDFWMNTARWQVVCIIVPMECYRGYIENTYIVLPYIKNI